MTLDPAAAETLRLPLSEVRPGMKGVGRTVFAGSRVEEFGVEILGVLENTGPQRSMVLARLEGGPLERTGVIAGMSGSPVFIEGKLVGAVAYGFPFSKETIAGITPIDEMLEATRTESPRAASARFSAFAGPEGMLWPLDREAFVGAIRRSLLSVAPPAGALPDGLAGTPLTPLPLPMVFSGFDPSTFQWAQPLFSRLGFAPVMGGGATGAPTEPLPPPEPGGAVAVSLIEGDLDVSLFGTLTYIDGDRVYAFGHPFYNLGPTQFPLKKAYVYSVFPSLYQSWKISAPVEAMGTVEQDRATAVAGRLGKTPRMIPVEVLLTTSRGQRRRCSFRLVEDELLSPVLAYMSLLSVLQAHERAVGSSTIRVRGHLTLSGGTEVQVDDTYTQNQPAVQAAVLVAAPMAYLLANDLEKVSVEKLRVEVEALETLQSAVLERAWLERTGPARPGSEVPLRLLLRTYRGKAATETIRVAIPQSARPGRYTLLVADAATLTALEQRELRQPFAPRTLQQLVRAINGLRRNHFVYVRLLSTEEGAVVAGEYMQSLPPSVLAVLGSGAAGPTVTRVRTSSTWEHDLETEYAVSGSRQLPLVIEP